MTRLLPIALVLAIGTSASAQEGSRRFDLGGFDAVELDSSDSIRVLPGSNFAITASGDPRAVASLALAVHGSTLHVDRTPGQHSDRGAVVTVTMPALHAATLAGSGSITASQVQGRSFAGRVSGSGTMSLEGVAVAEARLVLSGSGAIVVGGRVGAVAIDLGGSGRIDTRRVATSALAVEFGGSGSVAATSTGTAQIRASGSGSVRVGGGARCDVRNSGAANVRCG